MLLSPMISSQIDNRILTALADSCCRQILVSTMGSPKTVNQILDDVNCSKTRVYRKVKLLKSLKLLRVNGEIPDNGHKVFQYQSKIGQNLTIEFPEMTISLNLKNKEK